MKRESFPYKLAKPWPGSGFPVSHAAHVHGLLALGIGDGEGGHVHDVAGGAVGEEDVDGFAKAEEDGADDFVVAELAEDAEGDAAGAEVGEDDGVDVAVGDGGEGVALAAEFAVEGDGGAHFTVDEHFGVAAVEVGHGFLYLGGAAEVVLAEGGVGGEGDDGFHVELAHGLVGEGGDALEGLGGGVAVDGGVGQKVGAPLVGDDVHAGGVVAAGAEADDVLGKGVEGAVVGMEAGDESVAVPGLEHDEAEEVGVGGPGAGLVEGDTAALVLLVVELHVGVHAVGVAAGVEEGDGVEGEVVLAEEGKEGVGVADEDGVGDAFLGDFLEGHEEAEVGGVGEGDALGGVFGLAGHAADEAGSTDYIRKAIAAVYRCYENLAKIAKLKKETEEAYVKIRFYEQKSRERRPPHS